MPLAVRAAQRCPAVQEIVFGAPEASVDVHHHRKWTFGLGQTEVSKLIGVGAVGEMGIGWGRRKSENVVGGHGIQFNQNVGHGFHR